MKNSTMAVIIILIHDFEVLAKELVMKKNKDILPDNAVDALNISNS